MVPPKRKCGKRLRVSRFPKTGISAARYNGGMSPNWNGNDVPPMRMQTTDQPERGAQDLRLRCSVGMGGRDGVRVQEGSTAESEKLDDGDIYSR